MDITLSIIKADIGSIGGPIAPARLLETVRGEQVDRRDEKESRRVIGKSVHKGRRHGTVPRIGWRTKGPACVKYCLPAPKAACWAPAWR